MIIRGGFTLYPQNSNYPNQNSNYPNQNFYYPYVPEHEYRQSLTGIWRGDDGAIYYIHQPVAGNTSPIYWLGTSAGGGATFANVFVGDLRPDGLIDGKWGDVPLGQTLSHGRLRLRVEPGGTMLTAVQKTGGFAATVWNKQ
ncbi:hypothetical protein KQI67_22950 [Bacillus albus]|uniref:hypothetical protein n=1 Tax=Bacillus albus TaxID=2026189 RepID=UPI001C0F5B9F|nr:hypothetical protein [Bacillus albus]MBU5219526.1 hypothetical protein [Bacillus albus]